MTQNHGRRHSVLVFVPHYLPFVKGGGPIRSIANLVERLSSTHEFNIVTADRDHQDTGRALGVQAGEWTRVGDARVYRTDPRHLNFGMLKQFESSLDPDVLYINSFFNSHFSLLPIISRKRGVFRDRKIVIAPRGELYPGALQLKRLKKRVFLTASRIAHIHEGIHWHATSKEESEQIERTLIVAPQTIAVIANLPGLPRWEPPPKSVKTSGELDLVFVSRIVRKKGLQMAINALDRVKGRVFLHVYGPVEDVEYWRECQGAANRLSEGKRMIYHGVLEHDQVRARIAAGHALILPTMGENYGHVIVEALSVGRPVITSDQTPWHELQQRDAGHSVRLSVEQFTWVIQSYVDMNDCEYSKKVDAALTYAKDSSDSSAAGAKYGALLSRSG